MAEINPYQGASEAIAVSGDGGATTELSRQKESIIRTERLDRAHPVVQIELERIITEQGGSAVAISIQDFGLPPRVITISGDFVTMRDVADDARTDDHYANAPKKLALSTPNTQGNTYRYDDRMLPATDYKDVVLERGQAMLWTHDGLPSDERTGYIENSFWELVALMPNDYYGEHDFSGEHDRQAWGRLGVPLIGMAYDGSILSIYSLDDVHADVMFQEIRSLEDIVNSRGLSDGMAPELSLEAIIEGIRVGDEMVLVALEGVLSDRAERQLELADLRASIADAHLVTDALETVLAGNKSKLHQARQQVSGLEAQIRRLKANESATSSAGTSDKDFWNNLLGGSLRTSEGDPHGYCGKLGLDAEFLFGLEPSTAKRLVKGVHKALAVGLHSDVNGGGDEAMKMVNAAVDAVTRRLEEGVWGRH